MGCTQTIIANFEDVGRGFGLGPNVAVDRDELLRQALVVLAGEKYAVEMQCHVEARCHRALCLHLQNPGRVQLWDLENQAVP